MYKRDNILYGFIPCLIFPFLMALLIYHQAFGFVSFEDFFRRSQGAGLLGPILAISCLGNLLMFFFFLRTDRYYAARGAIMATVLYALITLFLKMF
ncbi:MAG: hypothetical protein NTX03_05455 [Bacteroidetes bacterium]|nr:hypothetical protein [Bacteroidota bacterium]